MTRPLRSAARLLAFRFAAVYALLFVWPFPLGMIPGTEAWADRLAPWEKVARFLAARLSGATLPAHGPTGSGDTAVDWARAATILAAAFAGALAWHAVDRRRAHPWLADLLRTGVRYALAWIMLGYGAAKLFDLQFPRPGLARLLETYGEASPMGLLWTFMGTSRAYSFFGGALEAAGAALLFFRRTTTLGALLLAGVLANVVMLNLCYDVPVKLFSAHLLAAAIALAARDGRALAAVLLLRRAWRPAPLRVPMPRAWMERVRPWLKAIAVPTCAYAAVHGVWLEVLQWGHREPPPLYGIWEVETFERDGAPVPPLTTEARRWRRLVVDDSGRVTVQRMDDSAAWYERDPEAPPSVLALKGAGDPVRLAVVQPDADHLALEGTMDGASLRVAMKRRDEKGMLLLSRGFHWVNERPFNR